jgi:hypothetical protein
MHLKVPGFLSSPSSPTLAHQNAISSPSVEMALLGPGYGLILPFLFLFTIPIALLAALTTTIAFSILLFRVSLVYIELALTIIPNYFLGTKSTRQTLPNGTSTATVTPTRRRKRRTSSMTALSGSTTPTPAGSAQHIRDYEGVGGWRLGPPSDDDDIWTKINSRLELPAEHGRRHQRSLTSGSIPGEGRQRRNLSSETMMNTGKVRTPPSVVFAGDSFFPQMPPSPGALRRTSSGLTGASVSSASSKASSMLNMKQQR